MEPNSLLQHYEHRIKEALRQVETWTEGTQAQIVDSSLNLWSCRFDTTAGKIRTGQLRSLTKKGHKVELKLDQRSWRATVVIQRGAFSYLGQPRGDVGEVFKDEQRRDAQSAIDDNEAARLIKLFERNALPYTVTCYLQNDPLSTGFHWAYSLDALHHFLGEHTWCGLATKLYNTSNSRRVVIEDAGDAVFQAQGLLVHGPDKWSEPAGSFDPRESTAYYERHFTEMKWEIPPPTFFQPLSSQKVPAELRGVDSLFRQISHALSWLWLGSEVTLTGKEVAVHFHSERGLDVDLSHIAYEEPPSSQALEETLTLWRRVVQTPDSLLFEALQKAVCATVRKPSDLHTAAGPVLRTTLMLHRIAEQGAVAEAFGVRESARKAALEATHSIAEMVRSATRSVVDRVFTQLGISAGVVVAYKKDLIDATLVPWLLALVGVLWLATTVVAFGYEFPSAQRFKAAFVKDLDSYRDTLTLEDINSIKESTSLVKSRTQLFHSVWAAALLIALQLSVLLGMWFLLV